MSPPESQGHSQLRARGIQVSAMSREASVCQAIGEEEAGFAVLDTVCGSSGPSFSPLWLEHRSVGG